MYSVLSVLESVNIVRLSQRKSHIYTWQSLAELKTTLTILMNAKDSRTRLKIEGKQTSIAQIYFHHNTDTEQEMIDDDNSSTQPFTHALPSEAAALIDDDTASVKPFSSLSSSAVSASNSGKLSVEWSIGALSQAFIQLFLSTATGIVSLVDANRRLFGKPASLSASSNKKEDGTEGNNDYRCLCDVADVLTSLNLIAIYPVSLNK